MGLDQRVGFAVRLFKQSIDLLLRFSFVRLIVKLLAMAPSEDHFAGNFAGSVEVARRAIRGCAVKNPFGSASTHEDDQFFEKKVFALDVLIFVRQQGGDAESLTARNNADF